MIRHDLHVNPVNAVQSEFIDRAVGLEVYLQDYMISMIYMSILKIL